MTTKKLLLSAITALFVTTMLSSCGGSNNTPVAPAKEQKHEYLDASAYDSWVYFSLKENKVVKVLKEYPADKKDTSWDPAKNQEWDIAIHRSELRVNAAPYGGKGALAVSSNTDFNAKIELKGLDFVTNIEAQIVTASSGMPPKHEFAMDYWIGQAKDTKDFTYRTYWFDHENVMKNGWMGQIDKMYKNNEHIFVVRAADGKTHYKIQWTGFMTAKGKGGGASFRYIRL